MSTEPQKSPPRAAIGDTTGYTAASDDRVDPTDLYEQLINPNDAAVGANRPPAGGGMMMPPMTGMGSSTGTSGGSAASSGETAGTAVAGTAAAGLVSGASRPAGGTSGSGLSVSGVSAPVPSGTGSSGGGSAGGGTSGGGSVGEGSSGMSPGGRTNDGGSISVHPLPAHGSGGVGRDPAGTSGDPAVVNPELLSVEYTAWAGLRDDLLSAQRVFERTSVTPDQFGLVHGVHPAYSGLWHRIDAWFASGAAEFDAIGEAMRQTAKGYYDTEIEAIGLGKGIMQDSAL